MSWCSVRPILTSLTLLLASLPASADPFPTRDQNPLLAGYGLPMPLPSRLAPAGEWSWDTDFNWASTGQMEMADGEFLVVDAETRELRLAATRALTDRWSVRFELPYRYTGGGVLDSFIDGWHDFFGMPEGERPLLPQDQIRIFYARDGVTLLDQETSMQGVGDVSAAVGYQLYSAPASSLAAWLNIELPTGDSDDLNGSGATDVALSLAGEHRFADRWMVFGQASVAWLGEGDLLPEQQRSVAWSGMAGIGADVWRGLQLKLQLDGHTGVFDDTNLDYLGDALILTVGGAWKFQSGWQLDIGISEDIVVHASPDVVFVIAVSKR